MWRFRAGHTERGGVGFVMAAQRFAGGDVDEAIDAGFQCLGRADPGGQHCRSGGLEL